MNPVKILFSRRRSTHLTSRALLSLLVALFLGAALLATPGVSRADVSLSVTIGPPALPVYAQPVCPGPGYIWVPGYWAWDPEFGYYWVPGMWTPAPFIGALWTPGYWGWSGGFYVWHAGYWGPTVGFYGGINYGFGYTGHGYYGGYWSGGRYYYNRTVNNVNVTNITTVYTRPVTNVRPTGPSFNGGRGGTVSRATPEQLSAARQARSSLTTQQEHHMQTARTDPGQRASVNRGRPAVAASPRPGVFSGQGVMPGNRAGGAYTAPRGSRGPTGERMQPTQPQRPGMYSPRGPDRMAPGTERRGPEPRYNQPRGVQQQPRAQRQPQPRQQREEMGEPRGGR